MRNSYQFPVEVTVGIDPAIGGPSAGLMFSLGIYDTLTEGSMTGGEVVAGTGTIDPDGTVGPIGGIDQKIAGARDDGADALPGAGRQLRRRLRVAPRRHAAGPGRHDERRRRRDRGLGRRPGRRPAPSAPPTTRVAPVSDPLTGLDVDPALAAAVLEIETHVADAGWDQPARLYALVDTARLVAQRAGPRRGRWGSTTRPPQGSLTPVEQDQLRPDQPLESVLEPIAWPPGVTGCAAVVERLVLPPDADAAHPRRPRRGRGVRPRAPRIARRSGSWRVRPAHGSTYCALRLRAHDDDAVGRGRASTWCRRCCSCWCPRWRP